MCEREKDGESQRRKGEGELLLSTGTEWSSSLLVLGKRRPEGQRERRGESW